MSENNVTVSVVGASGYAGGELLRFLLNHPFVTVQQVTSERSVGKPIHKIHPHLRGLSSLQFTSTQTLRPCDVLFLCLPHGHSSRRIDEFKTLSARIIDLSADFRLQNSELYRKWYGAEHTNANFLKEFTYGIPELHRKEMTSSNYVSSAGCNATATILALYPLYAEGLVDTDRTVVEVKVGSSEGGNSASEGSHHPVRSGCVRSFMPVGHRHSAEICQELNCEHVHFSATALDMVRGILATSHVFVQPGLTEKDIWKVFRKYYGSEPFIRIVKEREGNYRYPEPKLVAGTNYCDIGFALDSNSGHLVVMSAIDNLVKGAAGQAVQAFNIMHNFDEATALTFGGLHP